VEAVASTVTRRWFAERKQHLREQTHNCVIAVALIAARVTPWEQPLVSNNFHEKLTLELSETLI
jgi:hypothetical protein